MRAPAHRLGTFHSFLVKKKLNAMHNSKKAKGKRFRIQASRLFLLLPENIIKFDGMLSLFSEITCSLKNAKFTMRGAYKARKTRYPN